MREGEAFSAVLELRRQDGREAESCERTNSNERTNEMTYERKDERNRHRIAGSDERATNESRCTMEPAAIWSTHGLRGTAFRQNVRGEEQMTAWTGFGS